MSAVVCKNIVKVFGTGHTQVAALREVNMEVRKGELLMIVGPSGSGKTTLISVISGVLNQTSGDCLVYGENLHTLPESARTAYRGKHIGFVFQAFNLIPMLTAVENTMIPLLLNGIDEEEARPRAEEYLIRVGLKERMQAFPPQLSGGEQQRVAIARGCIHHPRLIVCDEPTSALDSTTGEKVLDLLKNIASAGESSLIIVTHDARIFHFADRIVHMEDGRIVKEQHNSH